MHTFIQDAQIEAEFRDRLRTHFLVTTLMIPIKTVAMILGMPESTLRQYVREGVFFMPHRRINHAIMVDVDDLVRWYCTEQCKLQAGVFSSRPIRITSVSVPKIEEAPPKINRNRQALVDRVVSDACTAHGVTHTRRKIGL